MAKLIFDNIEQIENLSAQRTDLFQIGSGVFVSMAPDGKWIVEGPDNVIGTISGLSPNFPTKDQLKARSLAKRAEVEVSGITWNGEQISTDLESQSIASHAALTALIDPTTQFIFKTKAGTALSLDSNTLKTLFLAISSHVQACRAKEAEILPGINSGAITSFEQVDAAYAAI